MTTTDDDEDVKSLSQIDDDIEEDDCDDDQKDEETRVTKCLDCFEDKCVNCSKAVFYCDLFDSQSGRVSKRHEHLRRGQYNECCKTATCYVSPFATAHQGYCPCTCRKAELKEMGVTVPNCDCSIGVCTDCKWHVYASKTSCNLHGTAKRGTYNKCCQVFTCAVCNPDDPDDDSVDCMCACELKSMKEFEEEEEKKAKMAPKLAPAAKAAATSSKAKAEKPAPKKKNAPAKAKAKAKAPDPAPIGKVQAADEDLNLPKWERIAKQAKKAAESRARVAEMMRASALETKARIERERAAKKSKTSSDVKTAVTEKVMAATVVPVAVVPAAAAVVVPAVTVPTVAAVATTTTATTTAVAVSVEKKRPIDAISGGGGNDVKDAQPQKRARVDSPATTTTTTTTKKGDEDELTEAEVEEQKTSTLDLKHGDAKSKPRKSAEQLKREAQYKKAIRADKCLAERERLTKEHAEFVPCSECDDDTRMCAKCKKGVPHAVPCIFCRNVYCANSKDCRCSCDTTRLYVCKDDADSEATESDDDDEVTILSVSTKCSR
jgi:hypothetical protein